MALSLNNLQDATGAAASSMSSISGVSTPGSNIRMSDFMITSISTITGTDTASPGPYTATLNFTGAGSRFLTKIANRYQNFTFSTSNPTYFTWRANQDYTAIADVTSPEGGTSVTIYGKFHDGANTGATNYNVDRSKSVTITDI